MLPEISELPHTSFPEGLREIPDTPKQLFIQGTLPDPTKYQYLAVVGSRKYSRYGKDVCEALIAGLQGYPICIVSGLALGIDAIAHQTALNAHLPTVAIPGSGLARSVLHPRSNHKLADDILKQGGALLSELEPEQPAGIHTFPARNRIMVAISHAVLLIEAAEKSGTLITARLTIEYNRDLLAVPHDITRPSGKGVNQFLKLGAIPVTKSEDILEALHIEPAQNSQQATLALENLSDDEERIIALLAHGPMPRDELIATLACGTSTANVTLSSLELKDIIKEEMSEVRLCVH